MSKEQIHFVTGKLAAAPLLEMLRPLSEKFDFGFTIQTMPISVAALMTTKWMAARIDVPPGTDRVIIPGGCRGEIRLLEEAANMPVQHGPSDLRRLPEFFGGKARQAELIDHDIEIIAEINDVPGMSLDQLLEQAKRFADSGADVIDLGCIPGGTFTQIGDYVRACIDCGFRVSIDSFNREEVAAAVAAGAELVLSVNSENVEYAADWGCEVIVIPDQLDSIASMERAIRHLEKQRVPFRIDPILEPIGVGLSASLSRYREARQRWPELNMMMGIGNLTELTDVDSAGINFMLLGVCQELGIRSVLTTEVINWARSSVAECEIARRIVHHAVTNGVPPKNLSPDLVMLRDPRPVEYSEQQIAEMAAAIRDHSYRILVSGNQIHLLGSGLRFSGTDPMAVFRQLMATSPKNLDPSHAFYLGHELCKARTAITLGKNYEQDEALRWGHLTVEEPKRERRAGTNFRE